MTSSVPMVQLLADKNGLAWRPAGVVIGIEGTSYPGFPGPPGMILDNGDGFWAGFTSGLVGGLANAMDGLWHHYLPGYSAKTIPMWPSVQEARELIVKFLLWYAPWYKSVWGVYPPIIMSGYSQGSMATDQVWVLDMLAPGGRLNFLKDFVYRIYQFGHIFRTPGIAHGNALIGAAESIKTDGVETGGIGASMDLLPEQTNYLAPDGRPVVHSCANQGDLYTCCPVGTDPWNHIAKEGAIGNDFEKVIMQPSLKDILGLVKVLNTPIAGIIELFNTMKFFAQGPNAPHYKYFDHMVGCINDALALGQSLPHSYVQ